ncbi:hypothetical protein FHX82_001335 [Amycolatopsis bartoniae]|uniref:Secreted protein n=1 Tax=Amycolatopsis bartoniae TaxID=941986 RepID=A0A8H9MBU2_9PSEU|nr:hypothetical protein [Amycolatopsis bartoniae]MBB2934315.1 hypothetical protein [Amycolatopsis bartoniae]TVT00129.1 hypothetical protein FNH07_32550 [Amycolatopsis bartoniae]GHF48247.1 hypothetical protein GCM10017566_21960 [Amycolatopsis bartoniae]
MRLPIRAAVAGCGAVVALAAGVPAASAETTETTEPTTPTYAPVTLSPEESQHLCADVLPKMLDHRAKLTARINGDANTKGSVAWLRARADAQRAKGHTKAADQLVVRADRRAGRLDDLKSAQDRLNAFKTAHCVAK